MNDTDRNADTLPLAEGPTVEPMQARYEFLEELGRGGMGVVFRARHRHLDKPVAVKIVRSGLDSARFLREARLLAKVASPHVVTVHDFDILPDGSPILVMELLQGCDLRHLIDEQAGPLDETTTREWMRQTAKGLLAAAQQGIIHRDIKPSNIRIDERRQARVMDFGLSRSHADPGGGLTLTDSFMGTPLYMAPEQAESPRTVDTRADIYSFGATFYHALTGRPPFSGETPFAVMFKHKTEPLTAPHALNPALSRGTSEVLERCLAKSPDHRFSSFEEVLRHLQPLGNITSSWESSDEFDIAPYLQQYETVRRAYLAREGESEEPQEFIFPGGRKLRLVIGDLLAQDANAIVSPEDSYLSMSNAMSARIANKAGLSVRRLVGQFRPVLPGRVMVTPAGKLPFGFILHAVTNDPGYLYYSRDIVIDIISAVLYQADTLLLRTVAMPLLGGEGGGLSEETALDVMFYTLARHLYKGTTEVRTVSLVLRPGSLADELSELISSPHPKMHQPTPAATFLAGRVTVMQGNITRQAVAAIVNAANETLLGGGGVDGAIHQAGGLEILRECEEIRRTRFPDGLPTGEAVITSGGLLPAPYVIHTVGPMKGQSGNREEFLASCYRNSLALAVEHGLRTIAFPAISTGAYGYPKDEAAAVASHAIQQFLQTDGTLQEVRLVFHSGSDLSMFLDHHQFAE